MWDKVIDLALKAAKKKEVPVGAIVVKDNKIIGKGYNKREKSHNILAHAEIIAIKMASKKLKTWKLDDCEIYVTLKPCSMCESVIRQSRIKNVYYLLDKDQKKKEYYATNFQITNECRYQDKYNRILTDFFKKFR